MNRAAAIGGVSKSQQKSWRPLRHEGRLGAAEKFMPNDKPI